MVGVAASCLLVKARWLGEDEGDIVLCALTEQRLNRDWVRGSPRQVLTVLESAIGELVQGRRNNWTKSASQVLLVQLLMLFVHRPVRGCYNVWMMLGDKWRRSMMARTLSGWGRGGLSLSMYVFCWRRAAG